MSGSLRWPAGGTSQSESKTRESAVATLKYAPSVARSHFRARRRPPLERERACADRRGRAADDVLADDFRRQPCAERALAREARHAGVRSRRS